MPDKRFTDFENLEQKIMKLKPGDHLCCIYENDQEHRALLTPFMRQGLERGQKIVYIVDARS
ncbi:MAG: MEDS domain-containing protein, partial [Planctomycetota bacterium]